MHGLKTFSRGKTVISITWLWSFCANRFDVVLDIIDIYAHTNHECICDCFSQK